MSVSFAFAFSYGAPCARFGSELAAEICEISSSVAEKPRSAPSPIT